MTTIERIIKLMEQNNIKDAELERMLGLKPKIVYGWKKGRSKSYMDFIPQLTQIFKVSPEYLLCLSDNESAYPLPPNMRPLTDSTVAMIPIVSTVRAGFGGAPEPVYDGTMAVYDRKNPQECVWMKVEGDSMSPNIMDGDYVLVHIQPTAENGDIIVAIWNGEEGTVKKYQRDDNGVMLIPLNTQYPTHFIANDQLDEFIIYGVVRETKRILG